MVESVFSSFAKKGYLELRFHVLYFHKNKKKYFEFRPALCFKMCFCFICAFNITLSETYFHQEVAYVLLTLTFILLLLTLCLLFLIVSVGKRTDELQFPQSFDDIQIPLVSLYFLSQKQNTVPNVRLLLDALSHTMLKFNCVNLHRVRIPQQFFVLIYEY